MFPGMRQNFQKNPRQSIIGILHGPPQKILSYEAFDAVIKIMPDFQQVRQGH